MPIPEAGKFKLGHYRRCCPGRHVWRRFRACPHLRFHHCGGERGLSLRRGDFGNGAGRRSAAAFG